MQDRIYAPQQPPLSIYERSQPFPVLSYYALLLVSSRKLGEFQHWAHICANDVDQRERPTTETTSRLSPFHRNERFDSQIASSLGSYLRCSRHLPRSTAYFAIVQPRSRKPLATTACP